MSQVTAKVPELIIEAGRAESQRWRDLWRYRELFYFVEWLDILVSYEQKVIRMTWALIRPPLTMLVFTVIFSKVTGPTSAVLYAILAFAALLLWQSFATSLSEVSNSLIGNTNLIPKVYFSRLIVPVSAVITSFVDSALLFVILLGLTAWHRFLPGWQFLSLPLWTARAYLAPLGPGLHITAVNIKYRGFRYVIPFIVQFSLYVSPVGFFRAVLTEKLHVLRTLYSLDPMVGVIDGFRWAIGGASEPLYGLGLAVLIGVTVFLLWLGVWYSCRMKKPSRM